MKQVKLTKKDRDDINDLLQAVCRCEIPPTILTDFLSDWFNLEAVSLVSHFTNEGCTFFDNHGRFLRRIEDCNGLGAIFRFLENGDPGQLRINPGFPY